jgi:hypothetical protein
MKLSISRKYNHEQQYNQEDGYYIKIIEIKEIGQLVFKGMFLRRALL